LAAAPPRTDVFARHLPMDRVTGVHLYVCDSSNGSDIQSRMFAPLYEVSEDPATGSANVALIGLLARLHQRQTCALQ
jgi:trans-2,3-dihydro-3-hydroxyanthranilate isomerase